MADRVANVLSRVESLKAAKSRAEGRLEGVDSDLKKIEAECLEQFGIHPSKLKEYIAGMDSKIEKETARLESEIAEVQGVLEEHEDD